MKYFVKATLKSGHTIEFTINANTLNHAGKKANACVFSVQAHNDVSDIWVGATAGIHCDDKIHTHHLTCGAMAMNRIYARRTLRVHGTYLVTPVTSDGMRYDYNKQYTQQVRVKA